MSLFQGLLNDLKRRPEDAAKELGVSLDEIQKIVWGEKTISLDIVERALKVWPLSKRDFFTIQDDCSLGVKIMRAEDSKKSARVMDRAGFPYYEYRDTAMSSVSLFRPEWIEELHVASDNSSDNTCVQWNNGHFMHQFTYFIGAVNYYYKDEEGKKHIFIADT